ncbi:hypothetical protein P5V15_002671 [Pogonomyrmex californicus]
MHIQDKQYEEYINSLQLLHNEFDCRFREMHVLEEDLFIFMTPFTIDINIVPADIQLELIDLKCDTALKNPFGNTTSNSVLNNMKHIHQNGHIDHKDHQNGFTNGTTYMQNDIAHLSNGIVSGNSKIIATMHNYLPKDPIRKMYNEVEGYQQNLHM